MNIALSGIPADRDDDIQSPESSSREMIYATHEDTAPHTPHHAEREREIFIFRGTMRKWQQLTAHRDTL
jgi:hypothetical protein